MSTQTTDTPGVGAAAGRWWLSDRFFNKLHHSLTALILVSFALIVILTTASTGPFVVVAGKLLFSLILLSAVTWLVTWLVKVWQEKRHPDAG
jgi:predicted MFS family arabinose efflux permease